MEIIPKQNAKFMQNKVIYYHDGIVFWHNALWIYLNQMFNINLPGFVPMSDWSIFHFGILGSNVWKKTHIQKATNAAKHP